LRAYVLQVFWGEVDPELGETLQDFVEFEKGEGVVIHFLSKEKRKERKKS